MSDKKQDWPDHVRKHKISKSAQIFADNLNKQALADKARRDKAKVEATKKSGAPKSPRL